MADRTLAEAVADLRLSDLKFTSDLSSIRRRLLSAIASMEADARVSIGVVVNEDSLVEAVANIESAATELAPVVPVALNADAALSDLAALGSIVEPIVVPVTVDADQALSELVALGSVVDPITVPVAIDDEAWLADLQSLGAVVDPVVIPVALNADEALADLAQLAAGVNPIIIPVTPDNAAWSALTVTLGAIVNPVVVPLTVDLPGWQAQLAALGQLPLVVSVQLDSNQAVDELAALSSIVDPIVVPVHLDTDKALADLAALEQLSQGLTITAHIDTQHIAPDLAAASASVPPITPGVHINPDDIAKGVAEAPVPPVSPGVHINPDEVAKAVNEAPVPPLNPDVHVNPDQVAKGITQAGQEAPPLTITPRLDIADLKGQIEDLKSRVTDDLINIREAKGLNDSLPQAFADSGAKSAESFGGAFRDKLQSVIGGIGLIAGGFLATSLVTGFERLNTINDATASLTVSLNSAAAAGELLGKVLDVVKGTPFNLDQFAFAASQMVAFGIEAKKVPGYLTAIGEAAATRGSRANEFAQRLATIFGQVQTAGRLSGQELLQFSEAGVNALTILANHFGITTEAVRDMNAKGLIPAKDALDAISEGILHGSTGIAGTTTAFAGTMAKLRDTLTGSIGGFKTAVARFGVTIIQPFQEALVAGFQGATKAIDTFAEHTKKVFDGIGHSEFVKGIRATFEDLPHLFDRVGEAAGALGPAFGPLAAVLGASGLGQLREILPVIGHLIPEALTPLRAAFAAFVLFTPQIRDELIPILIKLFGIIGEFSAVASDAAGSVAKALTPLFAQLIKAAAGLLPVVDAGAKLGEVLISAVVPAISLLATGLSKIPVPVLTALVAAFVALKIAGPVLDVVDKGIAAVATTLQASGLAGGTAQETFHKTQKAAEVMALGVAGAFAGMALASKSSSEQVVGAIGAIGSVAAGAITGGVAGAVVAGLGVAVGFIGGKLAEAKEKAAALRHEIDTLTTSFADQTKAILDDKDALILFNATANQSGTTQLSDLLGRQILADPTKKGDSTEGKILSQSLTDLSLSAQNGAGLIKLFDQIATSGGKIEKVTPFLRALTAEFGKDAGPVARLVDQYGSLDEVLTQLQLAAPRLAHLAPGVTPESLGFSPDIVQLVQDLPDTVARGWTTGQQKVVTAIQAINAAQGTIASPDKLRDIVNNQLNLNSAQDDNLRIALKLAAQESGLNREHASAAQLLQLEDAAYAKLGDSKQRGIILDQRVSEAILETGASTETAVAAMQEAIDKGINIEDTDIALKALGASAVQQFHDGRDAVDQLAEAEKGLKPPLTDAEVAARDLASAIRLSKDAAAAVTAELQRLHGVLNDRSAAGNFLADMRRIPETMGKIINESDLKKGESLTKSIGEEGNRVRELQAQVDKEFENAKLDRADLEDRIARAQAAGATHGVALLENELNHVNDKANAKKDELTKLLASMGAKGDELSKLNLVPTSVFDVLKQQAEAQHISVFDLILAQTTPEAQQAFEQQIAPLFNDALDQFFGLAQADPEHAQDFAKFIRQNLIDTLISGGATPEEAASVVDSFFNVHALTAKIKENARDVAATVKAELRAAFTAPDATPETKSLRDLTGALKDAQLKNDDPGGKDQTGLAKQLQDEFDAQNFSIGVALRPLTADDIAEFTKLLDVPVVTEPDIKMKTNKTDIDAQQAFIINKGDTVTPKGNQGATPAEAEGRRVAAAPLIAKVKLLPPDSAAAEELNREINLLLNGPSIQALTEQINMTPPDAPGVAKLKADLQLLLDATPKPDVEVGTTIVAPTPSDASKAHTASQDALDRYKELEAIIAYSPPDSAAAAAARAAMQELLAKNPDLQMNVSLSPHFVDADGKVTEDFRTFLQGHGLTVPVPVIVAPPSTIGRTRQREGGLVEFGFGFNRSELHIAQIVPAGTERVFAEPETHGEGYVPLSPFKRTRSTQIVRTIADLFGYELVAKSKDKDVLAPPPPQPLVDRVRDVQVRVLHEPADEHVRDVQVRVLHEAMDERVRDVQVVVLGEPLVDRVQALPMAMVGAPAALSAHDADMIGRAVAEHTKTTASDRAAQFAERYDNGVHFERGAIVVQGDATPRRTASKLVSHLAELAIRRRG